MKKVLFVGFLTIALTITGIFSTTSSNAEGGLQFMGPEFAKLLCDGWNNSSLPSKLAPKENGGNGWVTERNKYMNDAFRNKQVMIISRRDCPGIAKVQLTIENKDGKALCTYGGAQQEAYQNAEWAFAPETHHWYRFATGKWGMFEMPKIMTGFRGIYDVAAKNLGNFGIFWKVAGKIAKDKGADYKAGCPSLKSGDINDIEDYLKKIY